MAGMLSRDQKTMLGLGALAMLAVFVFWAASQFRPSQVKVMSEGVEFSVYIFLGLIGLILIVLGILMPVFVYYIYCDVRKMREIAERNEQKLEKLRIDFSILRQMWQK